MHSQRLKLTIAYRGTRYHGWQFQTANALYKGPRPPAGRGIPTVQEICSRAIVEVVRHPITLVGASRTDAGVHAKGQLAHFDTIHDNIPPENLRRAINHALPDDILVRAVEPVGNDFNVILAARRKRYQYCIWNALDRPPMISDLMWHRWQPLDLDAMRAAAAFLEGEHDFSSFARARHGRESAIRTIHSLDISQRGPRLVIGVTGNGFLWHMVRIIVGTLVEVGLGRFTPDDMPPMLAARDRRAGGSTAPPHGLYLQWVETRESIAP